MTRPTIRVLRSRSRRDELGGALITPSPALDGAAVLESIAGTRYYLPVFQPGVQMAGGRATGETALSDDGTLSVHVSGEPRAALTGAVGAASPYVDGLSFALRLDASGDGRVIPMTATREGGNLWRLTARLTGADLDRARGMLFDTAPNVALEITQRLTLAAQQSEAFIRETWSDATIRAGLLNAVGDIPFDQPGAFFSMVSGTDPEYPRQYIVLDCTYSTRASVPPLPSYRQCQVVWRNKAYNYYQDGRDPSRVFYLPDRFELAKGPNGAPAVSLLQFSLPDGAASLDKVRATFRFYGLPAVDLTRIEAAAADLRGQLGVVPQMVSLQDAHTVTTRFTLSLPTAGAGASSPTVQADATIDLRDGLRNEVSLSFAQFRALWAAIFSAAPENPMFTGHVDVALLDGRYAEQIVFTGRLPATMEEAFFDEITGTVPDGTYPATFTVSAATSIFDGPPKIDALDVMFANAAATLTRDDPSATVRIERPIRDIVIGKENPAEFPYRLQVAREDGSVTCCKGVARLDTPTLRLSRSQVAACTGACA